MENKLSRAIEKARGNNLQPDDIPTLNQVFNAFKDAIRIDLEIVKEIEKQGGNLIDLMAANPKETRQINEMFWRQISAYNPNYKKNEEAFTEFLDIQLKAIYDCIDNSLDDTWKIVLQQRAKEIENIMNYFIKSFRL